MAALSAELVRAAVAYARRGFPVFPVKFDPSGKKIPLVRWKAEATMDARVIGRWWKRWPLAMIGMPTGSASGIMVIDIDVKNGVDGFESLRHLGWDLANAPQVRTPSGGLHVYFQYPDFGVRNSAGKIAPGIDVRGEGGMIILPPSRPSLHGPDYCLERIPDVDHPMDWLVR